MHSDDDGEFSKVMTEYQYFKKPPDVNENVFYVYSIDSPAIGPRNTA